MKIQTKLRDDSIAGSERKRGRIICQKFSKLSHENLINFESLCKSSIADDSMTHHHTHPISNSRVQQLQKHGAEASGDCGNRQKWNASNNKQFTLMSIDLSWG